MVWCMSTRNKKLYTAGADSMIKVWDLENLSRGCIKTIQGHSGEVSESSPNCNPRLKLKIISECCTCKLVTYWL